MNYGTIPGVDKPISRLVQGTVMINGSDEKKEFALLDAVLDLGCTTFDMAHGYNGGNSERVFGKWLKARKNRDQVVILDKGAHHNQDRRRVTPFDITADIHDSLSRLDLDYIDLYVLHRDDETVPVGPIVEILNYHHYQGRIGAFGGSNWSHKRIEAANNYARANGLTPFAVSSPNFSLAEQVKEPWENCISISGNKGEAARAYYLQHNTPLFTWSSLAGGFFSGRFTRDNLQSFTEYLDKLCVHSYCYEDNFKRLDRVKELAAEKELSIPQIAVAYVMSHPLNIYALVGCNTPAEFKQNVEAMELRLSPEEMAWLELKQETR